jgi:hypothetical protein
MWIPTNGNFCSATRLQARRRLTALFSNTALAHELGRTRNWVVIYFGREGGPEHQRTVVTETRGPLEGWRVVRGREAACREHYFGTV